MLKTYNDKFNTVFFSYNEIPKEEPHYAYIAAMCIDSVLKLNQENYPQVYLEQCKYKQKKKKLIDFIDAKLENSSDDDNDDDDDNSTKTQALFFFSTHLNNN